MKTKRMVVKIDLELWTYLQQRRIATGASISELVRRDIAMARYQESRIEKRAGK